MSKRIPEYLRAKVRERANGCCEYCLIHDSDVLFPHEPDHIIARKHRGKTRIDNLAWACYLRNHRKGSDLASIDWRTGRIVRLFDPRRDSWARHFRLGGPKIVPRTAIGRATARFLQFNRESVVEMRHELIEAKRYPRE